MDLLGTVKIPQGGGVGKDLRSASDGTASWAGPTTLIPFSRSGVLTVAAGTARFRVPAACTIKSIAATVGTAPTGSSLIVDVKKNGTTIFTTSGNRPTIAASANASSDAVPDVTSLSAGDYLTVDVAQIGSTIAGSDLTIVLWMSVS